MANTQPGAVELKLYREAATAAFLWYFRLHLRPISAEGEGVPDSARGEVPFGSMVSQGPVSLPEGTTLEVADRLWSANRYKAEAAALLAIAPREAERRRLAATSGGRPPDLSSAERGTLSRAAETLDIADRQAWFGALKGRVDRHFDDPAFWNGVEVLVTAARGRGCLSDHEVEHLLQRAGTPRAPWPEWMPGTEGRSDFYFD